MGRKKIKAKQTKLAKSQPEAGSRKKERASSHSGQKQVGEKLGLRRRTQMIKLEQERVSSENHMSNSQVGPIKTRSVCKDDDCQRHMFNMWSYKTYKENIEYSFCKKSNKQTWNQLPKILLQGRKKLFARETQPLCRLREQDEFSSIADLDPEANFRQIQHQMPVPRFQRKVKCKYCDKEVVGVLQYIEHIKSQQHQQNWSKNRACKIIERQIQNFHRKKKKIAKKQKKQSEVQQDDQDDSSF